jgi:hypothetical protein
MFPSRGWSSCWPVSAGVFFLNFFCGGIVSCFSAETRWAQCWGVFENPEKVPEHARKNSKVVQVQ